MGDLDKYLEEAKNMAEDAGQMAKGIARDVVNKARDLTAEGSKVRELAESAKDQADSLTRGAREKVQGVLQDVKAGRELRQGLAQLEALPEFEGSIVYRMELETAVSYLDSLLLVVNDKRVDAASAAEELKKVIEKMRPAEEAPAEEAADVAAETEAASAEDQAIAMVRAITYNACVRALESLEQTA